MKDPIYLFYPEGILFLILYWILVVCFGCLCIASLFRFKFTIISTYKSEIVSVVVFIFLVALCIYHIVRILLLTSEYYTTQMNLKVLMNSLAACCYFYISFIVFYILLSLNLYYNQYLEAEEKIIKMKKVKIIFIIIGIFTGSLQPLSCIIFTNDIFVFIDFFYFMSLVCSVQIASLIYSIQLLKTYKAIRSEKDYAKAKKNVALFSLSFCLAVVCEYGLPAAFMSTNSYINRYILYSCVLYFLLFCLGEIIPFAFMLGYIYTLKECSFHTLSDVARDILSDGIINCDESFSDSNRKESKT
ncbi:hypothetical protein SteCoe_28713 [Stentor coeruleus]|uniref:Uncharacterized protein n=1 Tax=Stentor coeruleus TaxID=5963 RepID=A0A1R2B7X7_9CILI|nr:hypothetical protein SteCoe_28713 [Stentor coeruleus]